MLSTPSDNHFLRARPFNRSDAANLHRLLRAASIAGRWSPAATIAAEQGRTQHTVAPEARIALPLLTAADDHASMTAPFKSARRDQRVSISAPDWQGCQSRQRAATATPPRSGLLSTISNVPLCFPPLSVLYFGAIRMRHQARIVSTVQQSVIDDSPPTILA